MAIVTLEKAGISTEGLSSKSWDVFALPDAPQMDLVITVCDNAAGEVCPVWPGQPMTAHWGVEDPGHIGTTDAEKTKAFWDAFMKLHRRIAILLSLPVDKLDRLALAKELQKAEKVKKDIEKAQKNVHKATERLADSQKDLDKQAAKYKTLKDKDKLTPEDDIKWKKKMLKLTNKNKERKIELQEAQLNLKNLNPNA